MSEEEIKIEIATYLNPDCFTIHTNFNLKDYPELENIVNDTPGLEVTMGFKWGDYNYQQSFIVGKIFNTTEVAEKVKGKIIKYITNHD